MCVGVCACVCTRLWLVGTREVEGAGGGGCCGLYIIDVGDGGESVVWSGRCMMSKTNIEFMTPVQNPKQCFFCCMGGDIWKEAVNSFSNM